MSEGEGQHVGNAEQQQHDGIQRAEQGGGQGEVQHEEPSSSVSTSLTHLPSRTPLFTNYWRSNKNPVTYLATHERTIAPESQRVSSNDSADAFQRMVKRVTGAASAPTSKAAAKRANEAGQGGGPSKKGGAAAAGKAGGAGPSTSNAAAGAGKATAAGPSTSNTAAGGAAAKASTGKPSSSANAGGAGPSRASGAAAPGTSRAGAAGPSTSNAAAGGTGTGSAAAQPSATAAPAAAPAPPAAAAALAAAVNQQQEQQGGASGGARRSFTQDELKAKSVRDLKELCKTRNLQVSGNKDQLMQRIVEHQRRVKRASKPS